MKKAVALLMVLTVTSMMVFAIPVSPITGFQSGGSQDILSWEVSHNDFGDLFSDVRATPLTDIEASEVEGEAFWGGLLGGVLGGIVGAFLGSTAFNWVQTNFSANPTIPAIQASTAAGSLLGGLALGGLGAYLGYTYLPSKSYHQLFVYDPVGHCSQERTFL
jgi:hypothetical protein